VDAVAYAGPHSSFAYFESLMENEFVDVDLLERVADYAMHVSYLTRFVIEVTTGAARLPDPVPESHARLVQYVLRCYLVAHRRAAASGDPRIENMARVAWMLAMHMYGTAQRAVHEVSTHMEQRASDFAFCTAVTEHGGAELAVSDEEPVGAYTVHTHWQAFTTLITALYDYPYSPAMHDYVRALIVRHAQILEGEQDPLV